MRIVQQSFYDFSITSNRFLNGRRKPFFRDRLLSPGFKRIRQVLESGSGPRAPLRSLDRPLSCLSKRFRFTTNFYYHDGIYVWTYRDDFGIVHPFAATSKVYTTSCTAGSKQSGVNLNARNEQAMDGAPVSDFEKSVSLVFGQTSRERNVQFELVNRADCRARSSGVVS
jgi:hypothetical protein